jgi:hypothetical protein
MVLLAGLALYTATSHASERISTLERSLKDFKTRKELNGSEAARKALAQLGQHDWLQYEPPRWDALAALARVWAAGWQNSGHRWTEGDETEARAVLTELANNREPEARLARSVAHYALCRNGDAADPGTAAACHAAVEDLDGIYDAIPRGDDWHWLRVEAAFAETLERTWALSVEREEGRPLTSSSLNAALERCDEAREWLPWGPVNARELAEECLEVAGLAQDLGRYRSWATTRVQLEGKSSKDALERVYRDWGPECAKMTIAKGRSKWVVAGDPWCEALGDYALGCTEASLDVIVRNAALSPDRAWEKLATALAAVPAGTTCAR